MDKEGFIFLTVRITVMEANTKYDLATVSLLSLNQKMRDNNRERAGTTNGAEKSMR